MARGIGKAVLFAIIALLSSDTSAFAAENRLWVLVLPALPAVWLAGYAGRQLYRGATTPDVYRVWYASICEYASGKYTGGFRKDLEFGVCKVAIPQSHKFGSIGSSAIKRFFQRAATGADDSLYIIDQDIFFSDHRFVSSIKAALQQNGENILIYIHGYSTSFGAAIVRAAQIGFDLKVPGVTAAFIWPSKGVPHGYPADEDSIRLAERPLAKFFEILQAKFPDRKLNVIAHSMGNRALMDVLRNIKNYPEIGNLRFGQIFLAAPDIDERLFKEVASIYPQVSDRTTLYVCARDRALRVSGALKFNSRVGYTPPITVVEGIDTIDASNVDLDFLGHSYYAEAAAVLYDMASLLRIDQPPTLRPNLSKSATADGWVYWDIRAIRF